MWASNGVLLEPQANDIVADTGPLSAGLVSFTIFVWTNDAPILQFEHRNALNTLTLHSQIFGVGNIAPGGFFFTIPIILLINERLRVIMVESLGTNAKVEVSILSA